MELKLLSSEEKSNYESFQVAMDKRKSLNQIFTQLSNNFYNSKFNNVPMLINFKGEISGEDLLYNKLFNIFQIPGDLFNSHHQEKITGNQMLIEN